MGSDSGAISLGVFLNTLFPNPEGMVNIVEAVAGERDGQQILTWHENDARDYDPLRMGRAYYCISTCDRDPQKPRSRKPSRKAPVKTYVIVLDDIGTKIPLDRIAVSPTYALETSPNNFQLGYRLTDPVEPDRARALMDAIAAAGLTDPQTKSNVRVMRVPGSLNGKPQFGDFRARLTTWNPELSWSYSELCVAFGVTPTDVPTLGSMPELQEGQIDTVADWIMANPGVPGGQSGRVTRGLIPVHCPQEELHSPGLERANDSSTVWMPGAPGAFKCTHAHCQDLDTAAYLRWMRGRHEDFPAEQRSFDMEAFATALRKAVGGVPPGDGLFPRINHEQRQALSASPAIDGLVERLRDHVESLTIGPWILPGAEITGEGKYRAAQTVTQPRVYAVMDAIGMVARFNALTREAEFIFPDLDWYDPEADVSHAAAGALVHACQRCFMRGERAIEGYMTARAYEKPYHPVLEWIWARPWDGVDRLELLASTLHLRNPVHEPWKLVALRRWLIQSCAAFDNFDRGMKAESVGYTLVIQGPQRRGKSKWVESLLPKGWVGIGYSLRLDHNERDAVLKVTKTAISELGEVDAIFRKSDIASLKNFLTAPVDVYRKSYGKNEEIMPRCTTFIATVNPEGFLVDATGEGRFWPLPVSHCTYEHGIELQQLWAQAWHLYNDQCEDWSLTRREAEMHALVAAEHHASDSVTEAVSNLKLMATEQPKKDWHHVKPGEILDKYNIAKRKMEYSDLASHLERAGFKKTRYRGFDGWWVPNWNKYQSKMLQKMGTSAFPVIEGGKKGVKKGD